MDPVEENDPSPRSAFNWTAVAALSGAALFFLGLFLKEQIDLSALSQRETDHSANDDREFTLLQSEIDRRLTDIAATIRRQTDAIEKGQEDKVTISTAIAENKGQLASVRNDLTTLKERYDQGRGERIADDEGLGKRIEEMGQRLSEVQRQVSALEGKESGERLPVPKHP